MDLSAEKNAYMLLRMTKVGWLQWHTHFKVFEIVIQSYHLRLFSKSTDKKAPRDF